VPERAATTGVPSGAARSRPACINHLPNTGCTRHPKSLVVMAEPMIGNNSRRLPLPARAAGRGVTANTDSRRKPPRPNNAETGTVIKGKGRPSRPRRKVVGMPTPRRSRQAIRAASLRPPRTALPEAHSCRDRAPLRQACCNRGTSIGTNCVLPSSWRRSAGVITCWRSSRSNERSNRKGGAGRGRSNGGRTGPGGVCAKPEGIINNQAAANQRKADQKTVSARL